MACLVLAAGHALSVWLIGRDAWPGAGAGAPDSLLELARLLLVALALWYCALEDRHARASAAPTPVQPPAAAGHQAQDELRLAELAGALDTQRQMNALLSHELRAPLATISAAAQSLDMILAGNGEAVDNRLARIHRSVTRMTELLEQLLTQDRREEQALTPRGEAIDLATMARDVVAAMRPDTAHALVLDADGALPAYCDRSLTSVVLRNLIHNAVKYSPASEPIRIEAGASMKDGVRQAWIAVVDRGPHRGRRPAANFRAALPARGASRDIRTGRRALSGATHLRKPGRLADHDQPGRRGQPLRHHPAGITARRLTRPADAALRPRTRSPVRAQTTRAASGRRSAPWRAGD